MKKLFYSLAVLLLTGIGVSSCSSDDVLDSVPEVETRSSSSNILDYLDVVDGQWVCTISEKEAIDMGKQEEYSKIMAQISKINSRLLELKDNPKATLGFNLPNERIVMQGGIVVSRAYISEFEKSMSRVGSTLITTMEANQSKKFNTRSDEYEITSVAGVQSMFIWSFELRDNKWNKYWNESGVASANLSHNWIYSLTNPGIDNAWDFGSTGTQTDGTKITFAFYK